MARGNSNAELIRRARITRTDDSGTVQRVQADVQGDPTHEFDHLQPYGLTGVPPTGARALLLAVGAAWEHLVALATGHTDRPTGLSSGDVTLYSAHEARVDLRAAGTTVQGPMLTSTGYTDAEGGFRRAGAIGLTGTLKFTAVTLIPPETIVLLQMSFSGGILTSMSVSSAPWAILIGALLKCEWTSE